MKLAFSSGGTLTVPSAPAPPGWTRPTDDRALGRAQILEDRRDHVSQLATGYVTRESLTVDVVDSWTSSPRRPVSGKVPPPLFGLDRSVTCTCPSVSDVSSSSGRDPCPSFFPSGPSGDTGPTNYSQSLRVLWMGWDGQRSERPRRLRGTSVGVARGWGLAHRQ